MEPDSYETTRRLLDTGYLLGLFVSKGIEASLMQQGPDAGEVKIVLWPAPEATKKAISIKVL